MDLEITETLNGGDLQLSGNDLKMVFSYENMPYLAMFGGNPGQITDNNKPSDENDLSWWGNTLLFNAETENQMNSYTEFILKNVALNSSGASRIVDSIKKDLEFLSNVSEIKDVEIFAEILSDDIFSVQIKIYNKSDTISQKLIKFTKKLDGDFVIFDFNDDYKV